MSFRHVHINLSVSQCLDPSFDTCAVLYLTVSNLRPRVDHVLRDCRMGFCFLECTVARGPVFEVEYLEGVASDAQTPLAGTGPASAEF